MAIGQVRIERYLSPGSQSGGVKLGQVLGEHVSMNSGNLNWSPGPVEMRPTFEVIRINSRELEWMILAGCELECRTVAFVALP
jgi:hypothetical protein